MTQPASRARRSRRPRLDMAALLVAPAGVAVVVAAQAVTGIPAGALLQLEAALIVLGGTTGALLLTYAPADLLRTARAVAATFRVPAEDLDAVGTTLTTLAARAHRHGLISIDSDVDALEDPFMRDGLRLAVDDTDPAALKDMLATESSSRLDEEEGPARVLEAAAGYAPTLGILGAVLGLIHVMRTMGGPSGLGKGIAVAFVATVYGVGLANLILLPLAGRIHERAARDGRRRALMTIGILAIQARLHPRVLAQQLRSVGVGRIGTAAPGRPRADAHRPVASAPRAVEERRFA